MERKKGGTREQEHMPTEMQYCSLINEQAEFSFFHELQDFHGFLSLWMQSKLDTMSMRQI